VRECRNDCELCVVVVARFHTGHHGGESNFPIALKKQEKTDKKMDLKKSNTKSTNLI
jgi:hypothetical protein